MSGERMDAILASLDPATRDALLAHLRGGTSSRLLAEDLTRNGYPCGPTTVKRWRRANKETP